MFKRATRRRGQNSALGIAILKPLAFAKAITMGPPKIRQMVRKVQGGISFRIILGSSGFCVGAFPLLRVRGGRGEL